MKENIFDAPTPGQSLTDTPGNANWEHPPQFVKVDEAAEYIWDKLHSEEVLTQIISFLENEIPVEAIARMVLFGGFTEGKWTPDVAFIIIEPVLKMIAAIGIQGGVKKFRISMQDLTNNKSMKSIMDVKKNNEAFEKAAKGVTKSLDKPEAKGLMAAPQPQEEEMI